MAHSIGKKELQRLGKRYAERLLHNVKTKPVDMPELTEHPGWGDQEQGTKKEIVQDIKNIARRHLVEAGYNHETVARVIGL